MGIFDNFFGTKKKEVPQEEDKRKDEHAVIIEFNYGLENLDALHQLQDQLEETIEVNDLGEYDGHEMATDLSHGYIYMYGPNAEFLYDRTKGILEQADFMKGAKATLRFGPADEASQEIILEIGA